MNQPMNNRYQRRFANPDGRPSNIAFGQWAAQETFERVRELGAWIDAQEGAAIVLGAEQLLAQEGRRRQVAEQARREGWRRGDPGE
ncbi:MAG TPA: hypothetical protein VI172_08460 [Candidatus Dormibacteraeota bacterium]|jgi:hypothetical protein